MKKLVLTSAILLVFGFLGIAVASPIPFQVGTKGFLEAEDVQGGLIAKQTALGTNVFNLEEGQTSGVIEFFKIWVPLAWAEGHVDAYIDLLSPTPVGEVENEGYFKIKSFFVASKGTLKWEDPEPVGYSFNGSEGGLLTLNLFDIVDQWAVLGCYTIRGTLTNNTNPVPEPATMILLGIGLVGLVGCSKRKMKKI